MGISVDPRKLEKLERLSEALELLQNPEGYTRMIAEAKAVIQMQKEVSARYSTIEAADRFLQDSRKVLEAAKKEAASVTEQLSRDRMTFEVQKAAQQKQLLTRETTVTRREAEVTSREAAVTKREADLLGRQKAFTQECMNTTASLTERQNALEQEAAVLAKRKIALQAALA